MDEDLKIFLFLFILIVGSISVVVAGALIHEHIWLTEASDYDFCMSACKSSGIEGIVIANCYKECLQLSVDYECDDIFREVIE